MREMGKVDILSKVMERERERERKRENEVAR